MRAKILLSLAVVWLSMGAAHAASLTLTILGLHSDAGELLIGVYENAAGFASAIAGSATVSALLPQKWRIAGVSLRAKAGSQSITFRQLPPGRYAIIAFHDENDNGLLDANALGVPLEGYGFSNDAQGFLSAPSFDAAAVTLKDPNESKTTSISLIYPRARSVEENDEFEQFIGNLQGPVEGH
jgi:uncharacterized protein (DUF2141 family)